MECCAVSWGDRRTSNRCGLNHSMSVAVAKGLGGASTSAAVGEFATGVQLIVSLAHMYYNMSGDN